MRTRVPEEMLPTASWFHSADRSLMRFYGGHRDGKFACPPSAAGWNVSISGSHARGRVRVLSEAGLLEQIDSKYQITDLGLRYVRGEIDEDELESLNPDTEK